MPSPNHSLLSPCLTTDGVITHPFRIQSHQFYSTHSSIPPLLYPSLPPPLQVCQSFISVVFLFRQCYSSIPLSPLPVIMHLSSVITCRFILHYPVSLHPLRVPPYLKQSCNYSSSSRYRSIPVCPSATSPFLSC